jgi:hypothetical protein
MCCVPVDEWAFKRILKRQTKRFHRVKKDKRAFKRIQKKIDFLSRNSGKFGIIIFVDFKAKTLEVKQIKREEGDTGKVVNYPIKLFGKRFVHAESA